MAVAFSRYIDGTSSASSTTASLDFSACSVGDLALVLISRTNTTAASAVPSGWTLLDQHASTYCHCLYWKVLASGDIGTVTWTWASAYATLAKASVYTGADGTTPIESYSKGTFLTSSARTLNLGSVTTDEPWIAVLAGCYSTASRTYGSLWTSWSERQDAGSTDPDFWHWLVDSNGSHAGGTFTPSTSTNYIGTNASQAATYRGGFIIAINPVASTPRTADASGAAFLIYSPTATADGAAALQGAITGTADGSAHLSSGSTPVTGDATGAAVLTHGVVKDGLVAEYVGRLADGGVAPGLNVERTNYVTNPSFELDSNSDGLSDSWSTDYWGSGTLTRSRPSSPFGGYCQRVQTSGNTSDWVAGRLTHANTPMSSVSPGDQVTASVWVWGTSAPPLSVSIIWWSSSYGWLSESREFITDLNATTPQRYSVTATAPANAAMCQIAAFSWYNQVSGQDVDLYADRALLELQTATLGDYFDGSTDECDWTGTAHASTSVMRTKVWDDLVGGHDLTLAEFDWTESDGWDGDGSAADPHAVHIASETYNVSSTAANGQDFWTDDFTIDMWVSIDEYDATYNQRLFWVYQADSVNGMQFILSPGQGRPSLYMKKDNVGYGVTCFAADVDIVGDGWVHLVVTYNNTTKVGVGYLNGSLSLTDSTDNDYRPPTSGSSHPFRDHMHGSVATVRYYDRALTATEVLDNYTAGILAKSNRGDAQGSAFLILSPTATADGSAHLSASAGARTADADGAAALQAALTGTADGAAALQIARTSTADGAAALQQAKLATADGAAALRAARTSDADGAAALQAAKLATADGAAVLVATKTGDADGAAALQAARIATADGAGHLIATEGGTGTASGSAALQGAYTATADGAAALAAGHTQTADGAAVLRAARISTADGAAVLLAQRLATADGAAALQQAKTATADGAGALIAQEPGVATAAGSAALRGAKTADADGAAALAVSHTQSADGAAALRAARTATADGAAGLYHEKTADADGAAALRGARTATADGAADLIVPGVFVATASGAAALQQAKTATADGAAGLYYEKTADADGAAALRQANTATADGAAVLVAQRTQTADGAAALEGAKTQTADGSAVLRIAHDGTASGSAALQGAKTATADGSAVASFTAPKHADAAGAAFVVTWDVVFEVGAPECGWSASILDPNEGLAPAAGWRVDEPASGWRVREPQ